ncbi:hypothetical protein Nmel_002985, partial [Mimus melanotis]
MTGPSAPFCVEFHLWEKRNRVTSIEISFSSNSTKDTAKITIPKDQETGKQLLTHRVPLCQINSVTLNKAKLCDPSLSQEGIILSQSSNGKLTNPIYKMLSEILVHFGDRAADNLREAGLENKRWKHTVLEKAALVNSHGRVAVTPILESPGTGMERRSEGIVHPDTLGSCRGQGHLQGQVHGLVEEVKLFWDSISAEPVNQVSQLKQAGEDQQHVPDEDIQPTSTQPAPQSIAEVARGQEAKDIEGPKDATSPHVTQEDNAAGQL